MHRSIKVLPSQGAGVRMQASFLSQSPLHQINRSSSTLEPNRAAAPLSQNGQSDGTQALLHIFLARHRHISFELEI